MPKPIYLDHAAGTPIDVRVFQAMQPYWAENFYNPSSLYEPARRVKKVIESSRAQVAQVLGAKPSEIIFTAGATEANNLALFGIAQAHPGKHLVASAVEHESVLEPLAELKKRGWKVTLLPVKADGKVELKELEQAITNSTVLVSVMYANNEIGTIQPLSDVRKLINKLRRGRKSLPLYFHTDAAQAANYLPLQVSRLGVDLMTLNGSKIYGPKQSGCLYVRSGVRLRPLILGGGQERGLRSGTENVPAIVGFAEALELASQLRTKESRRLPVLRDYLIKQIIQKLDAASLNGDAKQRLPNNVNFTIAGISGESLVHHLDSNGFLVATGSACSANNDRPSHVLEAIGLKPVQINGSIRISLGRNTTKADIDRFIAQLLPSVTKLRAFAK